MVDKGLDVRKRNSAGYLDLEIICVEMIVESIEADESAKRECVSFQKERERALRSREHPHLRFRHM